MTKMITISELKLLMSICNSLQQLKEAIDEFETECEDKEVRS